MVNNLTKALFGIWAPYMGVGWLAINNSKVMEPLNKVREVDRNVDGWWLMLLEISSNSQPNPSDLKSFTQK